MAIPEPLMSTGAPEPLSFSRSHILLAACGPAEHAYECIECKRGYFTSVLLQALRSRRLRKLTYKRCFEEFPKLLTRSSQNPVCEGNTASRAFFNVNAQFVTERAMSFTMQQLNDDYFLKLGDAQGVSPGSKYGIYEDCTFPKGLSSGCLSSPGLDRPLWGSFKAYPCIGSEPTLHPFYSWCKLKMKTGLPIWPRAKLIELGMRGSASLKVFVSDAAKLVLDPNIIVRAKQGMMLVDSPDLVGTVILDLEHGHSGRVIFRLTGFPGELYSCYPDAARVHSVLISMAQWGWHRSRVPRVAVSHKPMVQLTMYELGKPNSLPIDADGSTSVKVSPTALYALKVKSHFSKRLYPYLFYFSTARQSIRPLYLGIYGSGHIETSLEPNSELTFGYNNDDMIPGALSFSIAPDEGYFQLFLTTSPNDFDSLAQSSPFAEANPRHNMATVTDDGYGDGLEVRGFSLSGLDETHFLSPPATPQSGSFAEHSRDIPSDQVFGGRSVSEHQQMDAYQSLEHSMRAVLPESTVLELLSKRLIKAQGSPWGVVSLKVTCKVPEGL
ncbi:unnamed protein product [Rhizoctonia solani]|uniref:Uncharacterized protein n=1 Tax=Rhizoctonia solani TaxID=456999 RepID=A0A8H3CV75_9AGAM|nr:unnamed protein product [Rhizoctonia solani]